MYEGTEAEEILVASERIGDIGKLSGRVFRMNTFRAVTYTLLRSYGTRKARDGQSGIRGRIKSSKITDQMMKDLEEIDPDDLEEFEADFSHVGESYLEHKRELAVAKQRLKSQIVASKYFKDVEPKFLTFLEKTEIQRLHKEDPEEWTVEKLSESFPALPDTIRKVLKVHWVPNSGERIMSYDQKVIENWEDFRNSKLPVSPALREHLMKFRHRKINPVDRLELAEKLLPPKLELPKPRSTYYRSLVQVPEVECSIPDQKLISPTHTVDLNKSGSGFPENKNELQQRPVDVQQQKSNFTGGRALTFNEFVKDKLEEIYKTSPEEGIVLLDVYRKQVEAQEREKALADALENSTVNQTEKNIVPRKSPAGALTGTRKENPSSKAVSKNVAEDSLDTYVKEWTQRTDYEEHYMIPIKIPKNLYKKGTTYRIKDCYYDYDGEFLYRTPGLQN